MCHQIILTVIKLTKIFRKKQTKQFLKKCILTLGIRVIFTVFYDLLDNPLNYTLQTNESKYSKNQNQWKNIRVQ